MDTLHCSDHSNSEAIAYCLQDKVLFCAKCYNTHKKHKTSSIDEFRKLEKTCNQVSLIQEISTLLIKHKQVSKDFFTAAEVSLDRQKQGLMQSIPGMVTQSNSKEMSKELKAKFISECKGILENALKYTKECVASIMQLVW